MTSVPVYADDLATLYVGDCLDVLRELPDDSVDSVVTDPPYGLEFMGKDWDKFGKPRDPRTAGRSGKGVQTGSAGIAKDARTPQGRTGVAFGGSRPTTWRCDSCGKRDQFRVHSKKMPNCQGSWRLEVIDPEAQSPLLGFQLWCEQWAAECLRVLKPGGHLLAFGGTRTWHRLAVAIEDAGFEIRDSIAWMYGSGFPKSLDVSKAIDKAAGAQREVIGLTNRCIGPSQTGHNGIGTFEEKNWATSNQLTTPATPAAQQWHGWGTALKPAHEPIVVARKPLTGTVAANVLEHGVGGLNIDGCRIGYASDADKDKALAGDAFKRKDTSDKGWSRPWMEDPERVARMNREAKERANAGRWPANVILDEDQAEVLDRQSGDRPPGKPQNRLTVSDKFGGDAYGDSLPTRLGWDPSGYTDSGGASRFFYVAKAPTRERPKVDGIAHPTVKPFTLMQYLTRLVTPPGGTILEPFAGSGTTVQAAYSQGFRCIAIEKEADYIPLIIQRIKETKKEKDDQLPYDT